MNEPHPGHQEPGHIERRQLLRRIAAAGLVLPLVGSGFAAEPPAPGPAGGQPPPAPPAPPALAKEGQLVPRRKLGTAGVDVSCLACGITSPTKQEVFDRALAWGIDHWDTAGSYSGAEASIGAYLAGHKGLRDKIFISTKVAGGWSRSFGSRVDGWAEADPATWQLTGAQIEVETGTVWSEHEMLTRNLIACGFFRVAEHPRASFSLVVATPKPSPAAAGPTHELVGDLSLNGITRRIAVPARIDCSARGLDCDSSFVINRRDFGVIMSNPGVYALLGDDAIGTDVLVRLTLKAVWPGSAEAPSATADAAAAPTAPSARVPAGLSPIRTVTIPATQVRFDLVLLPAEDGAPALYVGANEVTWDEFLPWALCKDIADETVIAEQRALRQRPSKPYVSVDRGFGTEGRPALGMSRLAAQRYCEWLSAATGGRFRLPTEAEWERAWRRGAAGLAGPPEQAWADRHAVWKGNSIPAGKRWNATRPVRSQAPDAAGLWDLAGSVAEWVVPADGALVVRGGHYLDGLDALGAAGRMVEDDEAWSANDPGDPKSQWWFTDATWTGFRMVCEL